MNPESGAMRDAYPPNPPIAVGGASPNPGPPRKKLAFIVFGDEAEGKRIADELQGIFKVFQAPRAGLAVSKAMLTHARTFLSSHNAIFVFTDRLQAVEWFRGPWKGLSAAPAIVVFLSDSPHEIALAENAGADEVMFKTNKNDE